MLPRLEHEVDKTVIGEEYGVEDGRVILTYVAIAIGNEAVVSYTGDVKASDGKMNRIVRFFNRYNRKGGLCLFWLLWLLWLLGRGAVKVVIVSSLGRRGIGVDGIIRRREGSNVITLRGLADCYTLGIDKGTNKPVGEVRLKELGCLLFAQTVHQLIVSVGGCRIACADQPREWVANGLVADGLAIVGI